MRNLKTLLLGATAALLLATAFTGVVLDVLFVALAVLCVTLALKL